MKSIKSKLEYIAAATSFFGGDLEKAERIAKAKLAEYIKFRLINQQVVPFMEGDLQDSIVIDTTADGITISWNTPYARRRYFEPANINQSRNLNAEYRWFDSYLEEGTEDNIAIKKYFLDQVIKNL